jgi:hypothetical protein
MACNVSRECEQIKNIRLLAAISVHVGLAGGAGVVP